MMRLIGAGLPRTATLSQKVALEMLGLAPCYHMVNVIGHLDAVSQWERAVAGDGDWQEIFDGFRATVDWPGAFFYKELIDAYPDAKVLLSTRGAEQWERSMRETIWGLFYGEILIRHLSDAWACVDPKWRAYMDLVKEMWRRSGLMSGEQSAEAFGMRSAMERYNEEVVQTVPAERLLVWSPGDGWEPLSEFLGVPVPDAPFPHLNDAEQFADRIIDNALLAVQQRRAQDAPAPA
jgi:hypothetical protein